MARPPKQPEEFGGLVRACRLCALSLIVLLPLFAGVGPSTAAQSRYPLLVSLGTHSLTVPWHTGPVTDRLNPAFVAGTERTLRTGEHVRWYQTANLGYFRHYWWMTGVFLETELGVSRRLPLGLHADLRLGVGYLHYFWRREGLKLEDGEYVQATDWGRPSIRAPLSVLIGYRGRSAHPLAVAPFISAQWAVQTPFIDEAPAMTHFLLFLGARIDLGRVSARGGIEQCIERCAACLDGLRLP